MGDGQDEDAFRASFGPDRRDDRGGTILLTLLKSL
jgi:hypothetical protein